MFNIYKLTHRLTGEVYVGATCNLRARMQARFQPKGDEAQFFVAPTLWELAVIDLAFTAEDAAAREAAHQAAVPPLFRVAVAGAAGAGLKNAAKTTRWPCELGPVDLEGLLRSPVTMSEAAAAARVAQLLLSP